MCIVYKSLNNFLTPVYFDLYCLEYNHIGKYFTFIFDKFSYNRCCVINQT